MKGVLSLLALAALLVGCDLSDPERIVSSEKASWQGREGTAVTITQTRGTKYLEGAVAVGFRFGRAKDGEFWAIADFTVPVLKVEPRAVTLFFSSAESDSLVLSHLPEALAAGRAAIVRCYPERVC